MKKLIALALFAFGCKPCPQCPSCPSVTLNDSLYTDVQITNWSDTAIQVFLTVQGIPGNTPVGLFGIKPSDTLMGHTTGFFWLGKGETRHYGSTLPGMGLIVTFGAQNQNCEQAMSNGWPTGINNFEFTINCFDKHLNPTATGGNESADITNVDGVNAILQYSVDTLNGRIGRKFWDYSKTDSNGNLLMFGSARTSGKLHGDCNVPGIFPYDCDVCYASSPSAPTPCFPKPAGYNCSDSLAQPGNLYTCQINRPGQGGVIRCEFFGFVGSKQPD